MKASMAVVAILAVSMICITLSEGRSVSAQELRCQCVKTERKQISLKHFLDLKVFPKGPHCKHVEVIATMKSGLLVCLEPTAPWVKQMINKVLTKATSS